MALERRLLLSTFKVLFDCTKFIVKVSVYPKFDHFSKKIFFAFSDRSYCNLSFKKKFYEKRLILSKVINRKRFFLLIISN